MIVEISKALPKFQVTIPKEVRESLNVEIGERIMFITTPQGFLIRKVDESLISSLSK